MQKYLVIQTAFIGDVVLATSVIEKLHFFYPDATIDMLVRKGNEKLLIGHPFLNNVIVWDKKKNKWANLFRLVSEIRKIKYDKVINLQRFFTTGLITVLSGGKQTIGFNKNPLSFLFTKKIPHLINSTVHEIQRNNDLISSFTDHKILNPKLYPTDKDFATVNQFKVQSFVTITPSSVWFTKQYPLQKWIDFIDRLDNRYNVYLLGGPDNKSDCEIIKSGTKNKNVIILAGHLGFLQSVALMKDAAMNYANDSAPLHFASSVNAPVAAVFCSTVPSFGFTPLSDLSFIIETKEALTCRPCGLHGRKSCPLGHFKCASTIETTQLLNTLPL
ncbi:MAG: glycosyltransferase family 9 protein [Ginsengibacter sp.]